MPDWRTLENHDRLKICRNFLPVARILRQRQAYNSLQSSYGNICLTPHSDGNQNKHMKVDCGFLYILSTPRICKDIDCQLAHFGIRYMVMGENKCSNCRRKFRTSRSVMKGHSTFTTRLPGLGEDYRRGSDTWIVSTKICISHAIILVQR